MKKNKDILPTILGLVILFGSLYCLISLAIPTNYSKSYKNSEGEYPTYYLNTYRKKFHYPSCPSVTQMNDENRCPFYGTREEAIAMGYSPCGNCKP